MLQWFEFFLNFLTNFFDNIDEGHKTATQHVTLFVLAYIVWDIFLRKKNKKAKKMSDKQVANREFDGNCNREVESESTQETTLTEITKDSGHTKSLEKKAEYEEHNKESIVEDHKTQMSQSSRQVTQSVQQEISENRQDFVTLKAFVPIQPFEPPKSFEFVKKLENERRKSLENCQTDGVQNVRLPDDYEPVEILPPIDMEQLVGRPEIKEEKIKNSLKEIISDLDSYVEKYERRKDSVEKKDENTPVDLEKVLTPADGEQIKPSRKMFASSAFYAKGLHPTVEEQVELAKRISSSLSDISNVSSKGQSMYVNRKKRSVKWVHEGEGEKLNGSEYSNNGEKKNPLTLVMNPHGKIQDINTLKKQGYTFESALSPDVCLEIVKDLNSPRGKGAELFAKRRKRSENWVVGSTETKAPTVSYQAPHQPSDLPETIQLKKNFEDIHPKVKLIKSPWEAALETGSVEAAFGDVRIPSSNLSAKGNLVAPTVESYENALKSDKLATWTGPKRHENGIENSKIFAHNPAYNSSSINRIVDNLQRGISNVDVYKPALPTAWSQRKNFDSSSNTNLSDKENNPLQSLAPDPIIRSVSPQPPQIPKEPLSDVPENLPFSIIPNVEIEEEIVQRDIEKFQAGEIVESSVRPRSPFPQIPDIKLNPEIIEKDIVSLRTSPTALNRQIDQKNANCGFYKTDNRKFESVSFTEKKYEIKNIEPEVQLPEPEFEYSIISPDFKVIENVFTPSTASNLHKMSSEIFESKGHFVANSSAPMPVFIPKSEEKSEFLNQSAVSKIQESEKIRTFSDKEDNEVTKILNNIKRAWETTPYKPEVDETPQIEDGNLGKSNDTQNGRCIPEDNHEKTYIFQENSEFFEEKVDMKESGDESQKFMKVCREIVDEIAEKAASETEKIENENLMQENKSVTFEESIPSTLCRKAPETIIGARPLFGRLDINSEFKKAITGRQKSLQNKRNREIYKASQLKVQPEPKRTIFEAKPCGNFQKSIKNDTIIDNSTLKSQFRNDEKVEREILKNEEEEFEKIYYQRERSLSVDLQVVSDEIIQQNDIKNIIDQEMSRYNIKIPSNIAHNNSLDEGYDRRNNKEHSRIANESEPQIFRNEPQLIRSDSGIIRPEPQFPLTSSVKDVSELFHKVPVKSLIENFEQNSMPTLKIKEYNFPSNENYYYVANTKIQTKYENNFFDNPQSSFDKYPPSSMSRRSSSSSSSSSSSGSVSALQQELSNQDWSKTVTVAPPPLTPTKFKSSVPSVFVPKETDSVLSNSYLPAYNAGVSHVEGSICKKIDFSSLHNYNTAPRGWNQTKNVYKPITFDSKPPYTDF